ncbi:MAG: hypothetical protein MJY87_04000 [Fibrobacter sp.]|nr:hypothetical protein [Fibrobacter sp.]
MIRKFIGASLLLAVLSLVACGSSSNATKDECTEDPTAPICENMDDGIPADDENLSE